MINRDSSNERPKKMKKRYTPVYSRDGINHGAICRHVLAAGCGSSSRDA
jgi:hypothetical protein